MNHHFLAILLAALATTGCCGLSAQSQQLTALSPREVFESKKVWDVHLRFSPDQWQAMQPTESGRPERSRSRSFLTGPEGGRNGIAAAFGIVFGFARGDVEFGSHSFTGVGIRYKGNGTYLSSRDGRKRSMKLDMNRFVKGQKLAGMTQINLHNSVRDPSNMNEPIGYRLFREGGVPAPRTAYAKVFVTVPDLHDREYFGLYNLVEDVGSHFLEEHFESASGALLKPVTPSLFGEMGDDWTAYNQTYDPKGKLSDEQKQRIIDTCKFVSHSSAEEFAVGIGDYCELQSFARYLALTVWMADLDGILGPGQNYYLYLHPRTRKFSILPWDQDQSFGQFPRGRQEQREHLSIREPWNGRHAFLEKLFAAEAFQTKYMAVLGELNQTVLQPDAIHGLVDEFAAVARAPIASESEERLSAFIKAVAGESVAVTMGPGFREPVQVKPIRSFVTARWKSVDDQLAGRTTGETFGRR